MLSLLLSTLEMMALTFIIGFIAAGVIKLISVWADSLEFHHSEELSQFSKLNKLRAKIGETFRILSWCKPRCFSFGSDGLLLSTGYSYYVSEEKRTDDKKKQYKQRRKSFYR